MAYDTGDELRRPVSLALAGVAIIGWLLAGFLWTEASRTQSELSGSLNAAERARESLAADLQNLQKAAGTAADLKTQGDRGGEGLVGGVRGSGIRPERARRPHKTDHGREARNLRRAGGGERQVA